MKKFGLLLGAFLILTGLTFWDNGLKELYAEHSDARVCFYLSRFESLDLSTFSEDTIIINSGTGIIVDVPGAAAAQMRGGFSDILGESVCFSGGPADAQEIMNFYRARLLWEEEIPLDGNGNSVKIMYGFSWLLNKSVEADGQRINIQIAVNSLSGKVTAGVPLILGSY